MQNPSMTAQIMPLPVMLPAGNHAQVHAIPAPDCTHANPARANLHAVGKHAIPHHVNSLLAMYPHALPAQNHVVEHVQKHVIHTTKRVIVVLNISFFFFYSSLQIFPQKSVAATASALNIPLYTLRMELVPHHLNFDHLKG